MSNFPETADIDKSSNDHALRFVGEIGALLKQKEATWRMSAPDPNTKVLDVGGRHGQLTNPLVLNG